MIKRIFVTLSIIATLGVLSGVVGYKLFIAGKNRGDIARQIIRNLPAVSVDSKVGLLSELLGFEKPKRYLVMFQNSTEIRPTGGFFGSYGLITVANGKIVEAKYGDPYALDKATKSETRPPSPAPIAKYTGIKKWFLRDANWDPDFPTSGTRVYQFWVEEGGDPNIDGVVAITSHVLPALMKLTGPVTVEAGITFKAETVVDELEEEVEYRWASRGLAWDDRKAMVGRLGQKVVEQIEASPTLWPRLVTLGQELLANRDIQIWMRDPINQQKVRAQNWDGGINSSGNFLMVVDANLGALKTDPFIEREVRYRTFKDRIEVDLLYRHRGTFTKKTTRYRSYTRVFVPKGSVALSADWQAEELPNLTSFGKFFSLEPGASTTLRLNYRTPAGASSVEQRQQPGVSRVYVHQKNRN